MTAIMQGQQELRDLIRHMWNGTPEDARAPIAVALVMPVLMMSYLLGWNIQAARISFMLSITIVTICVASLIARKAPRNVPMVFDYLAVSIFASSALIVFITPIYGLKPVAWRITAAAGQVVMLGAWITLWRLRQRWLSRTIAARAALAAGVGFGLFVLTNFLLTDPLPALDQWGEALPKGITGRTLAPIVEMLPVLLLYGLIFPPWLKYLRRHGAV